MAALSVKIHKAENLTGLQFPRVLNDMSGWCIFLTTRLNSLHHRYLLYTSVLSCKEISSAWSWYFGILVK